MRSSATTLCSRSGWEPGEKARSPRSARPPVSTRRSGSRNSPSDALVTGEPEEPALHAARELGIHFLAGGHYATETYGVQAPAARLADEFALDWEFVDLPNPV